MYYALLLLSGIGVVSEAKDCDEAPKREGVTLAYRTERSGGLYPNGTRVEALCQNRLIIVEGSCKAKCVDGRWLPELGRCPRMCELDTLKTKGYKFAIVYEADTRQQWFLHGTVAHAFCIMGIWNPLWDTRIDPFLCIDGRWMPHIYRNSECKRT